MSATASLLLSILVVVLVVAIISHRVKLPIVMELGMGMVALGSIAAIDSMLTDAACSEPALYARWSLIGGGLGLVLFSIFYRVFSHGKHRRVTDFIDLDGDELRHIRGGKGE